MSDDAQRWKEKYLQSIEQQDKLERRWAARLDLLRRGLVRSTLAHVSPGLDAAGVEALFPAAMAAYQRHYLHINGQHSRVYDGVVEGLMALQAMGLKLACLTNKPLGFARPLLAAKGLDGFFALTFGGDSFARKKPDPMPLAWISAIHDPDYVAEVVEARVPAVKERRIGFPVTALMESAAPPLVSPSILDRITPSTPTFSSNSFATFTASCPVIASMTSMV